MNSGDDRRAVAIAQQFELPDVVGQLLSSRGVALEQVEDFLNPTLRGLMPDPSTLQDMDKAVARVMAAIDAGEKIAVFGDYDVDGATSSSVLFHFLKSVYAPPMIYIPDRIEEGYGPNAAAFQQLKDQGASVVMTVDCGITAYEPLAAARDMGLDVIVLDHHVAEPSLPAAHAVVNPNRIDDTTDLGHLAAVGVTFLFVVALNRALRDAGHYQKRREPNLMNFLDLVALGTVADVVKLTGLNRAFVAQGLKVMAERGNVGLRALADVGRLEEKPTAYHLGFILGPRVNAGGRVGKARLGADLLCCDDPVLAGEMAAELDRYNTERKAIEDAVLYQANAQIEQGKGITDHLVMVAGEGWHPGVIGIVAGRLKENYNRPTCVVAIKDGVGKGSGRSIAGVALGPAVIAAQQAGLLINGGGHDMAAGFTVAADKMDAFTAFLNERVAAGAPDHGFVPELLVDGVVAASGVTLDLTDLLKQMEPFGQGNRTPRFLLRDVRVSFAKIVGDNHIKCRLTSGGTHVDAIAFRCADTKMGQALLHSDGKPVDVVGTVEENKWNGRTSVQMKIEDLAMAGVMEQVA